MGTWNPKQEFGHLRLDWTSPKWLDSTLDLLHLLSKV